MIQLIHTLSIIFIFSLPLVGQLIPLTPTDYVIQYPGSESEKFDLHLENTSGDSIVFDWSIDINFERTQDFQFTFLDFTQEYAPAVLSSCRLPFQNKLAANDTDSIIMLIDTKFIPDSVLSMEPVIRLFLHPQEECDTTLVEYTWQIKPRSTSTTDIEDKSIIIYPNPASQIVTISHQNILGDRMYVYNSMGELVEIISLENNISEYELDVSQYSDGVYIISTSDGSRTSPFVVQR